MRRLVKAGQGEEFSISSNDGLMFERRLCVPADSAVKIELLTEAHSSPFSMYIASTKMYQDLKRVYWWQNMKREVADFVSRCLVCQHVKALRLRPAGSWDFHLRLMEFAYNNSYQATIGMTPLRLCMVSIVDLLFVGLRQKSNVHERRKDLKFDVGDMIFLKVAPMKGVLRFEKKGKLSPRFVWPFEILKQICPVAYRLALPSSFSTIHDVFHVSMLRKYMADPTHVVDFEPL
ncbi:putative Retrotransposon protein [Cucumis melo var. makuwa]|uniref:Putative Retrotransposon protein n=1 Tax=Cucumis melo var. makuwa TaxID=1194695 RepID=A0A5D3DE52_CUCMM|nr:putative Retrotransposon protein [Cucumis melo var. makuwa]